jgi:hypothetical protein
LRSSAEAALDIPFLYHSLCIDTLSGIGSSCLGQ